MELMESGCEFGIPWPEFNDGLSYCDSITPRDQTKTLLEFYCSRYKQSASCEGWLQRIINGQILLDNVVTTAPNRQLRTGTCLEYRRHPWKEPAAPYCLQVLHEDQHVIALNKPLGLQVLPGGFFQQRTVLTQLQWRDDQMTKLRGINSFHRESWSTSPVHRLGRGTSGVLLCAKSPQAKSVLAADLAEGTATASGRNGGRRLQKSAPGPQKRFLKTYRALARGLIVADEITVDHAIGRDLYPGVAGGLYMASPTGKPSLSQVIVIWRNEADNCTLVQVEIFTGRPHQIRIHMAAIGHPLLGDPLYVDGGRVLECDQSSHLLNEEDSPAEDGGYKKPSAAVPGDCGYLLHAWRLEFYHPVSLEKMVIMAPPPLALQMPSEKEHETNRQQL